MNNSHFPKWIPSFLKFAGFYNLAWGVFILRRPLDFYSLLNEQVNEFPIILYPLGVAVLLFGVMYLYTANNVGHMRWFILVGFIAKSLGPLVAFLVLIGDTPKIHNFYLHIIFNDLLWAIPLAWAFFQVQKIWGLAHSSMKKSLPD